MECCEPGGPAVAAAKPNVVAGSPGLLCITISPALNLDYEEWGAAFPNKLLGAATLDRLRDGAYRVVLDGQTRRKPRPFPEPSKAAHVPANTGSPQAAARQR